MRFGWNEKRPFRPDDPVALCGDGWQDAPGPVGLVPTMGFFHDGHLSLMRRAREENDVVVVPSRETTGSPRPVRWRV